MTLYHDCYETLQWCAENEHYVGVTLFAFVLVAMIALSPLYLILAPIGWIVSKLTNG